MYLITISETIRMDTAPVGCSHWMDGVFHEGHVHIFIISFLARGCLFIPVGTS